MKQTVGQSPTKITSEGRGGGRRDGDTPIKTARPSDQSTGLMRASRKGREKIWGISRNEEGGSVGTGPGHVPWQEGNLAAQNM